MRSVPQLVSNPQLIHHDLLTCRSSAHTQTCAGVCGGHVRMSMSRESKWFHAKVAYMCREIVSSAPGTGLHLCIGLMVFIYVAKNVVVPEILNKNKICIPHTFISGTIHFLIIMELSSISLNASYTINSAYFRLERESY